MAKVCLTYVGLGCYGFSQTRDPANVSGESHWLSHGISLIAANLVKHGHEVSIIDMRTLTSMEHTLQEIAVTGADILGVSASMLDWRPAKEVLLIGKRLGMTTVVGGIVPSVVTETALECAADYIVTGEGEISMVNIADMVDKGLKLDDALMVGTVPKDLDDIPFIDRELWDYSRELRTPFAPEQETPFVTMIAGRGCCFSCNFCQPAESMMFPGKFRIRSVPNVIAELKELHDKYHFKSVNFWDDTFTIKPSWVMEFCDAYEREGFTAKFSACCRADIICKHPDMIKRMAEVGCEWLVIGFETGSDRLLKFIKKGVTLEQNLEAGRICKKVGIKMFATAMFGLPTETNDEAIATVKMIQTISPEHLMVFPFTPIFGTGLYDYCKDKDLLLLEDPLDIERSFQFRETIRGIDYGFLQKLLGGEVVG